MKSALEVVKIERMNHTKEKLYSIDRQKTQMGQQSHYFLYGSAAVPPLLCFFV